MNSLSALTRPCLVLVTDRSMVPGRLEATVSEAVAGGVNLVQLREKALSAGELLALGKRLRLRTQGRALLFINDRVDVALACEADGVQLPEDGLPVAETHRLAGLALSVGRSVHNVAGAVAAAEAGADLLIAGTIYLSRSHPEGEAAGPALITQIRAALPRFSGLLLGIGGITKDNAREVLAAGADGVAVISSILGAPNVRLAAQELRTAMVSEAEAQR